MFAEAFLLKSYKKKSKIQMCPKSSKDIETPRGWSDTTSRQCFYTAFLPTPLIPDVIGKASSSLQQVCISGWKVHFLASLFGPFVRLGSPAQISDVQSRLLYFVISGYP